MTEILRQKKSSRVLASVSAITIVCCTSELNLVLMSPGATQLTLMLLWASSGARAWVRPSRAVLLTLYGPRPCREQR